MKIRVKSTKERVKGIIKIHQEFKNSYFWYGNNKSDRLNWENNFEFKFNNDNYEIMQECNSSAKNVYYSLSVYVNNVKKDIRALKKIV